MSDDLSRLLGTVWSELGRGVADRRHPARHPTLATLGPDGPEARTLVLRAAQKAESRLDFNTDALSPKAAQIRADPRVSLHVWIPGQRLQIRARAMAELVPGDPDLFASLPPEARANYGGSPPGRAPRDDVPEADPDRFLVIRCRLRDIDALVLDNPHRRAGFAAPDWKGRWIAP